MFCCVVLSEGRDQGRLFYAELNSSQKKKHFKASPVQVYEVQPHYDKHLVQVFEVQAYREA